jgi:hypothetical protein
MLGLESIVAGAKIRGVAGPAVVEVVRVEWIGSDALNVVYRGSNGPSEVLLYREAEPRLELVHATRAFSFDGDGEAFRIASEAQRIRLAHLFDPYVAVHSSRIEPLPHQITAVYMARCCHVSLCASCSPMIPVLARRSWLGSSSRS